MTNHQIKDGGPAFPADELHDQTPPYRHLLASQGMTLRDYFAAKADVSVYAPAESFEAARGRKPTIGELANYIAEIRCVEADAMLAAREARHD